MLDPPQRATVSIVFLQGYSDAPFIYSTFFRSALCAAPDLFASVQGPCRWRPCMLADHPLT